MGHLEPTLGRSAQQEKVRNRKRPRKKDPIIQPDLLDQHYAVPRWAVKWCVGVVTVVGTLLIPTYLTA